MSRLYEKASHHYFFGSIQQYCHTTGADASGCTWVDINQSKVSTIATGVKYNDSSTSQTISDTAPQTWSVYVRDAAGNVSDKVVGTSTISSYAVTRSRTVTDGSASDITLTIRYDATSDDPSKPNFADDSVTMYMLHGTPIYIVASAGSGFTLTELKLNDTDILSNKGGYQTSVTITMQVRSTAKSSNFLDQTYLQDVTTSMCRYDSTKTYEQQSAILTDARDGKKYYVTVEKDDRCWMTQNLDLDLVASGNQMGYKKLDNSTISFKDTFNLFSSTYTNLSNNHWTIPSGSQGYTTQTTQGTYWNYYGCSGGNTTTYTWTSSNKNSTTYCTNGYEARSYDPGNTCLQDGATSISCTTSVGQANRGHNGNHYNWPAATAGSGSYSNGTNVVVSDSICPKGWGLAYGNNTSGTNGGNTAGGYYYLLSTKLGINTSNDSSVRVSPIYALRSGIYFPNSQHGEYPQCGYYWSSTAINNNSAYNFAFCPTNVLPGTYNNPKGYGELVRCVTR